MSYNGNDEMILRDLRQLSRELEEIKMSITGNTKLGIKGIAKRLDGQDVDLESLKSWRANINLKVAYTAGIVSGMTFGSLEGLKAILELVAKHAH